MHIVFYGPEGSGKGTQAKLLAEKLSVPHLVSGDLVRDAAQNDPGIIGDAMRNALTTGKYVPDSEMYVLWKRRLKEDDAKRGWVIDGFPRNIKQAKFLFDKVDKYGYSVEKVIYLKVSPDVSMERLMLRHRESFGGSGKNHDDPDLVRSRLNEFLKGQEKLIKYLKEKNVLLEINGEQDIDQIHQDIIEKLGLQ